MFIGGKSRGSLILTLDMLESFQTIISVIHFEATNQVVAGPYCTFAGLLLSIGNLSSILWVLVIAVHTFLYIACGARCREWVARKSTTGKGRWLVVIGVWTWVIATALYGLIFVEPFHPELGPYCIASSL